MTTSYRKSFNRFYFHFGLNIYNRAHMVDNEHRVSRNSIWEKSGFWLWFENFPLNHDYGAVLLAPIANVFLHSFFFIYFFRIWTLYSYSYVLVHGLWSSTRTPFYYYHFIIKKIVMDTKYQQGTCTFFLIIILVGLNEK